MSDYDVLVDTRDPHWGFILQSKSIARAALDTHTRTHAHTHSRTMPPPALPPPALPPSA